MAEVEDNVEETEEDAEEDDMFDDNEVRVGNGGGEHETEGSVSRLEPLLILSEDLRS